MNERVDPSSARNDDEASRPIELTWEDLVWLSKQSLGLRVVPTLKGAQEEWENGIPFGDALAISAITPGIPNHIGVKAHPIFPNLETAGIDPNDRNLVIAGFENAIKRHIAAGLSKALNYALDFAKGRETVEDALNLLEGPSLLIGDFGSNAQYGLADKRETLGLGKTGQLRVARDNLFALVNLPDKSELASLFSTDLRQQPVTQDDPFSMTQNILTQRYWQSVVEVIKQRPQTGTRIIKKA